MTDWRRAEWQYKANKWAVRAMIVCVLLGAPEVAAAFRYHFPWWDDVAGVATMLVLLVARFVQKRTEMYRWDH